MTACSGGGSSGSSATATQVQVTVTGSNQVRLGSTAQFTAVVSNSMNPGITWLVNSVAGGNSSNGTISATGLYSPPAKVPNPNTVTITAVSTASPSATGSATVSILNPTPVISTADATLVSGTSYLLDVQGTGFIPGSQIETGGQTVTTNYFSPTDVQADITVPAGVNSVGVTVVNPDPGGTASGPASAKVLQVTLAAAARLLDQATFGPAMSDIAHVQQVGINGYLTEQFNTPATLLPDIPATLPVICASSNSSTPCEESEWWQTALTGNDQLRQRVAFALSELFVISSDTVNARTITYYHNMLAKDAFGNFYNLMRDVSLSPGMGAYLDMLDSAKPPAGQIANENYPRELMQLFTIGLFLLNPDGSLQTDSNGNPIPAYTQAQVQAFARAYTGWTYATASGGSPTTYPNTTANYFAPMAAVENEHDMTSKTLLNGTVLPSGQSAEQDLQGALTNVFNHPNVGPFVCKQLIQHLVTSAPSAGYVSRVAAVFANDGSGVRGNLQAVIAAILTDEEARAGDTNPAFDGGHLREPILWITNVLRALGFTNIDPNSSYYSLSNYSNALNERPYRSGSVFNFFPPSYVIPETQLNAPEFGLENTASAVLELSLANSVVFNKIAGFQVDLSAASPLGVIAANSPGNLVDTLGMMFMHGQMPAEMRTELVTSISSLTDPAQRVRVATYLVITAPQYKIMH